MARLLSDVSNLVDFDGRRSSIQRGSKLAAHEKVKALVTPLRPRGDSTLGNQVKYCFKQETSTRDTEDKSFCVSELLKCHPDLVERGAAHIDSYLERNMPTEHCRGVAIKVFCVAYCTW